MAEQIKTLGDRLVQDSFSEHSVNEDSARVQIMFQNVPLLLCEDYSSRVADDDDMAQEKCSDDDVLAHLPVCQSFWARRHSSLSSSRGSSEKWMLGSVEEELNFLHLDMPLILVEYCVINAFTCMRFTYGLAKSIERKAYSFTCGGCVIEFI